ncbi:hypothetical protein C0991_008857, partial [Blastosporella zonata]
MISSGPAFLALLVILIPALCGTANSLEATAAEFKSIAGTASPTMTTARSVESLAITNTTSTVKPGVPMDLKTNSTTAGNGGCSSPSQRREWRSMGPPARSDYLKAIQCLQRLASTAAAIPGARTRFDDFQAYHISVTTKVHEVGQFLPWHRWFLHTYEVALRKECKYGGPIPYWDWTKDAFPDNPEVFQSSPIFSGKGGFGELPLVPRPLTTGPFTKYHLQFGTGPPPNKTAHLIERGFDITMLPRLTEAAVEATLSRKTFETFRIELEGRPVTLEPKVHDSGHRVVGGDMSDTYSSPG